MMSDRQEMANMVVQDRNIEKEKSVENQLFFFFPTKRKRKKQDVDCPSTIEG